MTKRGDEVLQGIIIPRKAFGYRNIYLKLRRRGSFDFPVLGVAGTMGFGKDGTCLHARIVLTAVSSWPVVVDAAAQQLEGKKVTREAIEAAAEAAAKVSHPLDNADMEYWYRKRMTRVYVRRALASLSGIEIVDHGTF
jgi:CO/xanthine dehydrogenase FAD-binding subunit